MSTNSITAYVDIKAHFTGMTDYIPTLNFEELLRVRTANDSITAYHNHEIPQGHTHHGFTVKAPLNTPVLLLFYYDCPGSHAISPFKVNFDDQVNFSNTLSPGATSAVGPGSTKWSFEPVPANCFAVVDWNTNAQKTTYGYNFSLIQDSREPVTIDPPLVNDPGPPQG